MGAKAKAAKARAETSPATSLVTSPATSPVTSPETSLVTRHPRMAKPQRKMRIQHQNSWPSLRRARVATTTGNGPSGDPMRMKKPAKKAKANKAKAKARARERSPRETRVMAKRESQEKMAKRRSQEKMAKRRSQEDQGTMAKRRSQEKMAKSRPQPRLLRRADKEERVATSPETRTEKLPAMTKKAKEFEKDGQFDKEGAEEFARGAFDEQLKDQVKQARDSGAFDGEDGPQRFMDALGEAEE